MEKHPLHVRIPDLQRSSEVSRAVAKRERYTSTKLSNDPGERIEAYLRRPEKIFLNERDSTHAPYLSDAIAEISTRRGLPLGNLTSQLLVNIYLNEFDQFVKHRLKAKYYIRYADDFVILSHERDTLERLHLTLHPDKLFICTFASGVDFLGWVHFPDHRVLRASTKWRMLRRLEVEHNQATIDSYLGLLTHGNAYNLHCTVKRFVAKLK